jgi:SAM-dependent methyltransferase
MGVNQNMSAAGARPDLAELAELRDTIRSDIELSRKMTSERLRSEYRAGRLLLAHAAIGRPKKGSPRDLLMTQLGITKTERYRWTTLAALPEHLFEGMLQHAADRTAVAVKRGDELSRAKFLRTARDFKRRAQPPVPALPASNGVVELHVADIRGGLPFVADGSTGVIITDPLYDRKSIPLLECLGAVARRVLVPGGICAALVGNLFLPEKIAALATHLSWVTEVAYVLPSPIRQATGGTVTFVEAMPVLVFSNGPKPRKLETNIVYAEHAVNNEWHRFGQCSVGFARLVELLSTPSDTVLDPFCGGGTTGVACAETGRDFMGCDIDPETIAIARRRLGRK